MIELLIFHLLKFLVIILFTLIFNNGYHLKLNILLSFKFDNLACKEFIIKLKKLHSIFNLQTEEIQKRYKIVINRF